MVIWKYEILHGLATQIEIPKGFKPLSVQTQGDQIMFWAMVDSSAEKVKAFIRVVGTGWELGNEVDAMQYIGTFQFDGGAYVYHAFIKEMD